MHKRVLSLGTLSPKAQSATELQTAEQLLLRKTQFRMSREVKRDPGYCRRRKEYETTTRNRFCSRRCWFRSVCRTGRCRSPSILLVGDRNRACCTYQQVNPQYSRTGRTRTARL